MSAETTITSRLSVTPLQALDMSNVKKTHISEMPEEFYQRFVESQERMLEHHYTQMPDFRNHPSHQSYAEVHVNGKPVATLSNSGAMGTSNAIAARLNGIDLPDEVNGTNGPALAQARAEAVAKALGGEIVMSSTAISQSRYNALPDLEFKID